MLILVLDLAVVHRKNKDVSIKDALFWTGVWGSLAMGVNLFFGREMGGEAGSTFSSFC